MIRQRTQDVKALGASILSPVMNPEKRLERKPTLLSVSEIPDWYKNNDFILHGYRPVSHSVMACIESLWYVHNETANIFSHLLPAIATVLAQIYLREMFWYEFPNANILDYSIFAFHILAVTLCFGLSASYHTLLNHSAAVMDLCARIDYVGILVMILGSFVSGIYLGFYCEPHLQKTYWAMILTFGILTAFLVLNPAYKHRRYRHLRLSAFVALGFSAFAPIIHGMRLFDLEQLNKQSGLPYYYLEGALILTGVFFFASHIPERLYPGCFDTLFHSHFIFHCFTVLAGLVHFQGIWKAFEWNYRVGRCPR